MLQEPPAGGESYNSARSCRFDRTRERRIYTAKPSAQRGGVGHAIGIFHRGAIASQHTSGRNAVECLAARNVAVMATVARLTRNRVWNAFAKLPQQALSAAGGSVL